MKTILMQKEFWQNSYFSIVKYTCGITISDENGDRHDYYLVNAHGETPHRIQLENPRIPCDLIDGRFIPMYRSLGRDRFLAFIKDHDGVPHQELIKLLEKESSIVKKREKAEKEAKRKALTAIQPSLFSAENEE